MKPSVVIMLCLTTLAVLLVLLGAVGWLATQMVDMTRTEQANAIREEEVFREALLKMPSLVVDDPVMTTATKAIVPAAGKGR